MPTEASATVDRNKLTIGRLEVSGRDHQSNARRRDEGDEQGAKPPGAPPAKTESRAPPESPRSPAAPAKCHATVINTKFN